MRVFIKTLQSLQKLTIALISLTKINDNISKLDGRIDKLDDRNDKLDAKIDSRFLWTIGIMFRVFIKTLKTPQSLQNIDAIRN